MKRRDVLKTAIAVPLLTGLLSGGWKSAFAATASRSRVRPGNPGWPSPADWDRLKVDVGGRLLKLESPFAGCTATPMSAACSEALQHIKNPYYLGDQPALTQTSGWLDAWTSKPSAYAVAAETTADVVAAVNFARENNLRLVVKGGGHSYQGTSDAPDSLLVWTRRMHRVTLHDAFIAQGCEGTAPQPAVTIEAGAMWVDAYNAVTTRGGRYVQGGGCMTVGVAGLVQSGGFGSSSKNYGSAAAGLLEAEIVTADGSVRIANACTNPDLFWGIKGGGGGSLGVVTRLTLRTRELPEFFGAVMGEITASTEEAYRALIAKAIAFYQAALFNPHWGEQLVFKRDTLELSMLFQGLTQQQAEQVWAPFIAWVRADKAYSVSDEIRFLVLPARHMWDAEFFAKNAPGVMVTDDRPGAARDRVLWSGNVDEAGQFLHAYRSAWLPASLLREDRQAELVDALFASTRQWQMSLHFNKGLAGAPPRRDRRCAQYGHQSPGAGCVCARHLRGRRCTRISRHAGFRAGHRQSPSRFGAHQQGDGRTVEGCTRRRFVRLGKRLFRTRMATLVLGHQLSEACRGETQIRSRRPVLRPPWRRQRSVDATMDLRACDPPALRIALNGAPYPDGSEPAVTRA